MSRISRIYNNRFFKVTLKDQEKICLRGSAHILYRGYEIVTVLLLISFVFALGLGSPTRELTLYEVFLGTISHANYNHFYNNFAVFISYSLVAVLRNRNILLTTMVGGMISTAVHFVVFGIPILGISGGVFALIGSTAPVLGFGILAVSSYFAGEQVAVWGHVVGYVFGLFAWIVQRFSFELKSTKVLSR